MTLLSSWNGGGESKFIYFKSQSISSNTSLPRPQISLGKGERFTTLSTLYSVLWASCTSVIPPAFPKSSSSSPSPTVICIPGRRYQYYHLMIGSATKSLYLFFPSVLVTHFYKKNPASIIFSDSINYFIQKGLFFLWY